MPLRCLGFLLCWGHFCGEITPITGISKQTLAGINEIFTIVVTNRIGNLWLTNEGPSWVTIRTHCAAYIALQCNRKVHHVSWLYTRRYELCHSVQRDLACSGPLPAFCCDALSDLGAMRDAGCYRPRLCSVSPFDERRRQLTLTVPCCDERHRAKSA